MVVISLSTDSENFDSCDVTSWLHSVATTTYFSVYTGVILCKVTPKNNAFLAEDSVEILVAVNASAVVFEGPDLTMCATLYRRKKIFFFLLVACILNGTN